MNETDELERIYVLPSPEPHIFKVTFLMKNGAKVSAIDRHSVHSDERAYIGSLITEASKSGYNIFDGGLLVVSGDVSAIEVELMSGISPRKAG